MCDHLNLYIWRRIKTIAQQTWVVQAENAFLTTDISQDKDVTLHGLGQNYTEVPLIITMLIQSLDFCMPFHSNII